MSLPKSARVLIIWGREDRVIPVAHTQNAPAGARVEILEGAGHMAQMERAKDVNPLHPATHRSLMATGGSPDTVEAWCRLGHSLVSAGKRHEALLAADRAAELLLAGAEQANSLGLCSPTAKHRQGR